MPRRGTETEFELTTLERLEGLGYGYTHGGELDRPREEVVLVDRLQAHLRRRYPDLSRESLVEVVRRFSRPEGVDTLRRNMVFHHDLTRGYELAVERQDGSTEHRLIYPVDWYNPEANDFLVVNQFSVRGQNDRRPDIVVFVNGLPLAVFELKNPWKADTTVEDAFTQITHYRHDISQLFDYNAVTVISDGVTTLQGMWSAPREHFAPWQSIDGLHDEPATTASMKTLVDGLFTKDRLLAYVRDFIVFEVAADTVVKKGAKYHQFFAVRLAAQKALEVYSTPGERRIGVIWHTTGSGKSLSMAFLVAILRKRPELANPTFVIQVDRRDLDDQLHDQFVAARSLVGTVEQANSVDELRDLLRTEGGGVIFTTIEKFRLKNDAEGEKEVEHPLLSTRRNLIVIADEAHRSQYGFLRGYARYLATALPSALRLGFTGTPISFGGADTVEIFGNYIHTYDIRQAQRDRVTVPIYYEPRLVKIHLNNMDIDAALAEAATGFDPDELERKKSRWAALARAAGAADRLNTLARDLLEHFRERSKNILGKAMVVCMTRENCVRLCGALTALPGCPEVKVVMTGDITKDPESWNAAGHITTKARQGAIKQRMIDPDDSLKIVIVCDMWLTGTDIPCLHTLYIDKPMRGHNMIQAVSRVNRVFRDKPHGLAVDYIGVGDELRQAADTYARGAGPGTGKVAEPVSEAASPVFFQILAELRRVLPEGIDYGSWRRLSRLDLEDRYARAYGYLVEFDERRNHFLQVEHRLSRAYLLVKHLDDCLPYADEIIFYQQVRKQLVKAFRRPRAGADIESAVRDLMDDSIESEGVVDIFAAAGIERADISILDDEFLQTFKGRALPDLRLKLLEQILQGEFERRERRNLATVRSFRKLLEETLRRYHNRLIDAAAVVRTMIEIRQALEAEDRRAAELGLEEEELAFYDAIVARFESVYGDPFLRDLVHDVVRAIKDNLKVDWTEPHRENVQAAIRSAVKQVLRRRGVKRKDFYSILPLVMEQAVALYQDWPLVA